MDSTNYILFDPKEFQSLLPFAYTRAVADFRVGIFTIKEKWEFHLDKTTEVLTREYLQPLYGLDEIAGARNVYVDASVMPDSFLVEAVCRLKVGQSLLRNGELIATASDTFYRDLVALHEHKARDMEIHFDGEVQRLANNWDIFRLNGGQILMDMAHLAISSNGDLAEFALSVRNPEAVFIEKTARVDAAIINASGGPVYIGKGAEVMDGAVIIGPVAICDNAVVKAGARIYPDTTIGPWCKVGGEIGNSVLFACSNKGHDGYLGNSVIGEWCNLGADTNTSNLKNNYASIKCWDYKRQELSDTGLQFCGLMMGDHSKTGINTMFNTGTVVGVAANVFGGGFPPKYIPSFSWGGHSPGSVFRKEKVYEMAERMMERRGIGFTDTHRRILAHVFDLTAPFRAIARPVDQL